MKDLNRQNYYFVIFGVSGSGKTLIGRMLAEKLNIDFIEGDDFHPKTNVEKMKAGHPLTDADRMPWLKIISQDIATHIYANEGFVLSCSALKKNYRDILRKAGNFRFLFLDVSEAILTERMSYRKNHFMPASLLHSQIETLEIPGKVESDVIQIDANQIPNAVVKEIISKIDKGNS